MRAKRGFGKEVKELIAEYRIENHVLTHHIIMEVALSSNRPQVEKSPNRIQTERRLAEIKARLQVITTGEPDLRIN